MLGPKPTWNYERYKHTLISNIQEIHLFYLWYNSRIRWLITINLHCSRFSRLITVKLLPLNERLECKPIDRSRRHTVGADRRQPTASCICCAAVEIGHGVDVRWICPVIGTSQSLTRGRRKMSYNTSVLI